MRFVIRDFTTCRGGGYAIVHVDETGFGWRRCQTLERHDVHADAYWRDNGEGLVGFEHHYPGHLSAGEAEAAHRRRFEVDFPMRRHECVDRYEQWLNSWPTGPEIAAELRLDDDCWDDLWSRFVDAYVGVQRMTSDRQRGGHRLVRPEVATCIREHVARHPDEYPRLPARPRPAGSGG